MQPAVQAISDKPVVRRVGRGDDHAIELLLIEHSLVVGVGPADAEGGGGGLKPLGVAVAERDQLGICALL